MFPSPVCWENDEIGYVKEPNALARHGHPGGQQGRPSQLRGRVWCVGQGHSNSRKANGNNAFLSHTRELDLNLTLFQSHQSCYHLFPTLRCHLMYSIAQLVFDAVVFIFSVFFLFNPFPFTSILK